MSADPTRHAVTANPPGLPPVSPPTAGFIVRLFLVPALIVTGLVAVAYGYHFFFGLLFGSPSPEQFIKRMDDANPEVRWRAAADLSQVLPRDPKLASDAEFALRLADRLDRAHRNSADAEASFQKRVGGLTKEEAEAERKKLEGERNFIQYLSACLGNVTVPVGVPVLRKLAEQDGGAEPKALAEQRRRALWALANLGENCKRFDKLPPPDQAAAVAQLEGAAERGEHAEWARLTVEYLQARQAGKADAMGVTATLAKCADAEEPFLRELTAFALNFWFGTDEENAAMEKILVALTNDKGQGEAEQAQLAGEDSTTPSVPITKKPGRKVSYNATIALARRGSAKTPLNLLDEMLDENALRDCFVLRDKSGKERPDEEVIIGSMVNALKAVGELYKQKPSLVTSDLRDSVQKLTQHPNPAIQNTAKQTQALLDASK